MRSLKDFLSDETGATAVEYALIASGIGLVIFAAINGLGTALAPYFERAQTALQ
ncbi:Flp/Fap pilin protein [Afipia sp. P52-10]|jgi:pilus assembly protein Flp/PilA|uniref:Flp family type IVb pilin n=1 Tax=Afipia sp. P52-10 TaxID=1429916 RepID=UPI0003DF35C8|nr:Flp family type IVb pilin [Afipia sp. P52-10]ETR75791.1 Flp/Fap pilin protein [Afipia sp. P52-10]